MVSTRGVYLQQHAAVHAPELGSGASGALAKCKAADDSAARRLAQLNPANSVDLGGCVDRHTWCVDARAKAHAASCSSTLPFGILHSGRKLWDVGCGMWVWDVGVGCGMWDVGVGCGMWDVGVGCGMWDVGCGMWDVGCGMWDVGCGYGMWDVGCGMWDLGVGKTVLSSTIQHSLSTRVALNGERRPVNGER
eukprot:356999-Chlamydomonas_euryale.AAC.3